MLENDANARLFRPDLDNPTIEDGETTMQSFHILPTPWIYAEDVANAAAWLASDEARFITGTSLMVDAGFSAKYGFF
jgi:(+)-trans-carveol dehydrogenase